MPLDDSDEPADRLERDTVAEPTKVARAAAKKAAGPPRKSAPAAKSTPAKTPAKRAPAKATAKATPRKAAPAPAVDAAPATTAATETAGRPAVSAPVPPRPSRPIETHASEDAEPIDLMAVGHRPAAKQLAPIAAGLAVVVVALVIWRRRRSYGSGRRPHYKPRNKCIQRASAP
jgi:hypothetical protein